ncbi:MAG TPA: hypothetical protein VGC80_14850, partial [Acetobacteraceae bacterium]
LRQIMAQSRHDTAVLALPHVHNFDSVDLFERNSIDVQSILAAIPRLPDTVLVVPWLVVGGGDKYAADLAGALPGAGRGPVLVLVTDQTETEAEGWERHALLAPFRATDVVFWRDACGPGHANPTTLARL